MFGKYRIWKEKNNSNKSFYSYLEDSKESSGKIVLDYLDYLNDQND